MIQIKRLFDIFFSCVLLIILSIPIIFIAMMVKITSGGPVFYVSDRVGKDNSLFVMYKFRTMKRETPSVATHLLENPKQHLTSVGHFLRSTSLDEIPQLVNILKGDMSFVGPRPALYNQKDLIALRSQKGIHTLVPGLTGWAQINGRDELPITEKVDFDEYYYINRSLLLDAKILFMTALTAFCGKGVAH